MADDTYKQIIHSCLDEVTCEYMLAAKQGIMDYVLKSPVEQRRLGLQALAPLLAQKQAAQTGKARVANWDLPDWWHLSVATAREEIAWTLQTLSANSLELNELWIMQGFSSRSFPCQHQWFDSAIALRVWQMPAQCGLACSISCPITWPAHNMAAR